MRSLPALHLHLDDLAVGQHSRQQLLRGTIRLAATVKRIARTADPRQAAEAHFLFDQEAVRLGLIACIDKMRGCDLLGEGIDALETLAVVGHHFADAPEIIQGQRAVLATAITLGPRARRRLEVAVAHRAVILQNLPHLEDGFGMLASHTGNP